MKLYEKYMNEGDDLVDLEGAFEELDENFNIIENYLKTGLIDEKSIKKN